MAFIKPNFSRERVKKAGQNFRSGRENLEDIEILENWRGSHLYVLNTFQANLRTRAKKNKEYKIIVAQRLKRRSTIIDKLAREPNMQLSTMQDLVGCRLIFNSIDEPVSFRSSLEKSRFKHERRHSSDKYDYISKPKTTGYRGIHDIYHYKASSEAGAPWNGLAIEVQYRTIFQHSWATAVEVIDLINRDRIKFDDADAEHVQFFRFASELISRRFETSKSCLSELNDLEVRNGFNEIEKKTGFLETLRTLSKSQSKARKLTNSLLILRSNPGETRVKLSVENFKTILEALQKYNFYEKQLEASGIVDVVFVRGASDNEIALAYSNYFTDTADFCRYISMALES